VAARLTLPRFEDKKSFLDHPAWIRAVIAPTSAAITDPTTASVPSGGRSASRTPDPILVKASALHVAIPDLRHI